MGKCLQLGTSKFLVNKILDSTGDIQKGGTTIVIDSLISMEILAGNITVTGDVLVNGANNNNGNAKLSVDSGITGSQLSLNGDQIQLGNTRWNHMKLNLMQCTVK